MPCILVTGCQCFRGIYCLHVPPEWQQSARLYSTITKKNAIFRSRMAYFNLSTCIFWVLPLLFCIPMPWCFFIQIYYLIYKPFNHTNRDILLHKQNLLLVVFVICNLLSTSNIKKCDLRYLQQWRCWQY